MKLITTSAAAIVMMTGVALADSSSTTTTQTDNSMSAPVAGSTSVQRSTSTEDSNGVKVDKQQAYKSNGLNTEEHKSKSVSTPDGSESHSVDKSQSIDGSSSTTTHSSSSTGG